jgi:hypothetical protein
MEKSRPKASDRNRHKEQVRTSVLEEKKAMIGNKQCVIELVNREEKNIRERDEKECDKGVVYIGCVLDIALK